jgi:hypothetical protein
MRLAVLIITMVNKNPTAEALAVNESPSRQALTVVRAKAANVEHGNSLMLPVRRYLSSE